MTLSEFLDLLILLWLMGTWFYEGHHRRCSVVMKCPICKSDSPVPCGSQKNE